MIFINNSAVFIIYCISDTFISSIIAKNLDKGEHVKILPLINLKRIILRHSLCKQFYCAILWIRAMPLRIPSCTPEASKWLATCKYGMCFKYSVLPSQNIELELGRTLEL